MYLTSLFLAAALGSASSDGERDSGASDAGELGIRGFVSSGNRRLKAIVVSAVPSDPAETLAAIACPCESRRPSSILECRCGQHSRLLKDHLLAGRGEAKVVATTVSANDGSFALTGLSPGKYSLWADSPELGTELAENIDAGARSVVIRFSTGFKLRGTVVAEDGSALADALVRVVSTRPVRFFDTRTAGDGSFFLGPLPRAEYTVVAAQPGRLPATEPVWKDRRDALELKLRTPHTLEGTLLRQGRPVAGVNVSVRSIVEEWSVGTDADGRFAVSDLEADRYRLKVLVGREAARRDVDLSKGDQRVVLALEPAAQLDVEVVDEAGAPIAGAELKIIQAEDGHQEGMETDKKGSSHIEGLSPGNYEVKVSAMGFLKKSSLLRLTPLKNESLRIELQRAALVEGRVVDEAGEPVPFVELWADAGKAWAATNRDGTFVIDGLTPGIVHLWVRGWSFLPRALEVDAPSSSVHIVLERGNEIAGQVVDERGRPQPGALVSLDPGGISEGNSRLSDQNGRFTFGALWPGLHVVTASAEEGEHVRFGGAFVHVPSQNDKSIALVLREGLKITGYVRDERGQPIVGATVIAEPALPGQTGLKEPRSAISNRSGWFDLRHLPPGGYFLSATRDPRQRLDRIHQFVRAGTSGVEVSLSFPGRVVGRVLNSSSQPVTTYLINGEVFSNRYGKFEFIPRTAGLIRLNFESSEFGSASLTVRLEPGATVAIPNVVLTPLMTLRGRVVDEVTGEGVSGAGIRIAHTDRKTDSTLLVAPTESDLQTGDDGVFVLEQVARGEAFWVTHPVLAGAQFVASDPSRELTVRLKHAGTITGRLFDADGRTSEKDSVSAYGLVESHSIVVADGTFDLGAFEPGMYTVTGNIYRNGRFRGIGPRSIEVDGRTPATLELREPTGGTTVKVETRDRSGESLAPIALLVPGDVSTPKTIGELTRVTRDAFNDWNRRESSVIDHVPPGKYSLLLVGELIGAAVVHRKKLVVHSTREQKVKVMIASPPEVLPFGLGDEMPFFMYHSDFE